MLEVVVEESGEKKGEESSASGNPQTRDEHSTAQMGPRDERGARRQSEQ